MNNTIIVPSTLLEGVSIDPKQFDVIGHYRRVLNPRSFVSCCMIGCRNEADFAIFERGTDREQTADDFSYACDAHLGDLIGHAGAEHRPGTAHYVVVPMGTPLDADPVGDGKGGEG